MDDEVGDTTRTNHRLKHQRWAVSGLQNNHLATKKGRTMQTRRYGASLGGPLCDTHNPTLSPISLLKQHKNKNITKHNF
jgi:hypothetical protein